ncbi:hypothetical protein [Actinomadura sp. CNU-125]|uniref:hypothetical protein n=1 Tax=Actinomadura sp. CNU-125 TaxID=1904961 RepID=UPI0021CC7FB9|nr:hypothetical protein [Actinomadura sp. CNU-125]
MPSCDRPPPRGSNGLPTSATLGSARTSSSIGSMTAWSPRSPPASRMTIWTDAPACTDPCRSIRSDAACESVPGSEKSLW